MANIQQSVGFLTSKKIVNKKMVSCLLLIHRLTIHKKCLLVTY